MNSHDVWSSLCCFSFQQLVDHARSPHIFDCWHKQIQSCRDVLGYSFRNSCTGQIRHISYAGSNSSHKFDGIGDVSHISKDTGKTKLAGDKIGLKTGQRYDGI